MIKTSLATPLLKTSHTCARLNEPIYMRADPLRRTRKRIGHTMRSWVARHVTRRTPERNIPSYRHNTLYTPSIPSTSYTGSTNKLHLHNIAHGNTTRTRSGLHQTLAAFAAFAVGGTAACALCMLAAPPPDRPCPARIEKEAKNIQEKEAACVKPTNLQPLCVADDLQRRPM